MLLQSLVFASLVGLSSQAFSDATARNLFLPIAAAAYSDNPQACLTRVISGKVSKQLTEKIEHFTDKGSGFTFYSTSKKVVGLSFRGTSNTAQLVSEVTQTGFESKVPFQDGGSVSKYFNDAFTKLWNDGLGADLQSLIKKYPGYELWITGHSLGAALASLAAAHIAANNIYDGSKIVLYTFGQPRIGDQTYANEHDKLVPNAFRVTHNRDIVVHVPPEAMKYVHHETEVFYLENMGPSAPYSICKGQEDKACSDEFDFDTSVDDHTHYYEVDISSYGEAGCQ